MELDMIVALAISVGSLVAYYSTTEPREFLQTRKVSGKKCKLLYKVFSELLSVMPGKKHYKIKLKIKSVISWKAYVSYDNQKNYYTIYITVGILRTCSISQIVCIIAHELGHVFYGDCLKPNPGPLFIQKSVQRFKELRADSFGVYLIKRYNRRFKKNMRIDNPFGNASNGWRHFTSNHPDANIRRIVVMASRLYYSIVGV